MKIMPSGLSCVIPVITSHFADFYTLFYILLFISYVIVFMMTNKYLTFDCKSDKF